MRDGRWLRKAVSLNIEKRAGIRSNTGTSLFRWRDKLATVSIRKGRNCRLIERGKTWSRNGTIWGSFTLDGSGLSPRHIQVHTHRTMAWIESRLTCLATRLYKLASPFFVLPCFCSSTIDSRRTSIAVMQVAWNASSNASRCHRRKYRTQAREQTKVFVLVE